MSATDVLLSAIAADPGDDTGWLALADCLEELGQSDRAELVRLREWLRHASAEHPERRQREARLQSLLAAGVSPVGPRLRIELKKGLRLELALIPPGSFLMGSPNDEEHRTAEEEAQHQVTLTKAFWLAVHPVTQNQWQAITGTNPSQSKGDRRPVDSVSWHDCREFCQKLSQQTGRTFSLPTEAQWEYACRAGTTTPFYFGATIAAEQANYDANHIYGMGTTGPCHQKTIRVGSFLPNAWGLFDMHGNIWEWCDDGVRRFKRKAVVDPVGRRRSHRIVRGGSWIHYPWNCRSASRFWRAPDSRFDYLGCRLLTMVS